MIWLQDADVTLFHGDVLAVLPSLAAESVDCVVTSPPYWGLRSYLTDGHDDKALELGLEPFIGSGTVAHVARKLGRHSVGIDLNESYLELAARRLQQQSLFTEVAS